MSIDDSRVRYWLVGENTQNFGDYISEYLTSYLFFDHRPGTSGIHIIGSVIDDIFVPPQAGRERPVVFWGCGVREPGGLSRANWPSTEIRAVRGPLSAAELDLGADVPQGDPAFLLPALYRPRKLEALRGKTLCIPHFHDTRDDDALRAASGCDVVVRSTIAPSEKALTDVIDAIFSADFVLASAMHACLVAAAYRRPFAFWSGRSIDLPFKWRDAALSLSMPCVFVSHIDEGRRHYAEAIAPAIRLPDMRPSLLRAPLLVRASGLAAVLRWYRENPPAGGPTDPVEDTEALARFATDQQRLFDSIVAASLGRQPPAKALAPPPHPALFLKMLFQGDGTPRLALRRLLFHTSGKPRRLLRRWLMRHGAPPRPLHPWMRSDAYRALPKAFGLPPVAIPRTRALRVPDGASAVRSERPPAGIPIIEGRRRVLLIDGAYPTPDRDSGSIDAVYFVRIFRKLGYSVYFSTTGSFSSGALSPAQRAARAQLQRMGAIVMDDVYARSIKDLIRANGFLFDLFFLSRVHAGGQFYETVRAHAPDARILFNSVDLHYVREGREGCLEGNKSKIDAARATRERELHLVRHADATLVVSEEELTLLRKEAPEARVHAFPLIRDIAGRGADFAARRHIGFIGGYKHQPNIDAVQHFLEAIWPRILAELPEAQFHLMGADMPDCLSARTDPGLVIVGHVPDLRAAFEDMRLTVAPLRYGAGAKGKVLSSLTHGVPCICTSIAAEGMQLDDDGGILVADAPDDFAALVVRAYRDEPLWQQLSSDGLRRAEEHHSFAAGLARMTAIAKTL
ncbi:glycosyltransferase [Ancylobacter sp.]|uniref:glycosyltransferase n=1 Tax=Ancylobacter sp. TaxID=1872567 RepID=UPI003C7DA49B